MPNKKWRLSSLFLLLVFALSSCADAINSPKEKKENGLTSEQQYFIDIAFGNEFEADYEHIRKWATDIKIFVPDTTYSELNKELKIIIAELNSLSEEIEIYTVDRQSKANYILYFGDAQTYITKYEPKVSNLVEENWGVFYTYWNSNYQIYKGSMYVDVVRTTRPECEKHLLREELT